MCRCSPLVILLSASALASGQTTPSVSLSATLLPDSPGKLLTAQSSPQVAAADAPQTNLDTGTGSIRGHVEDFTGAAVPGAALQLTGPSGFQRNLSADAVGSFRFPGLAPGLYQISATAANMGTYISAQIELHPGESLEISKIALAVGATRADIQVTANPQDVANVQIHEEEHQRVFGLIPNFYSSYVWDASPLNTKQKFSLTLHTVLDPFAFVGAGLVAGFEQERNTYPGYGQGAAGFGKRYGSAYAIQAGSRVIGSALLPSIFRQDPRYFYKGSGTNKERALYAIRSAFLARGDNGNLQPNYSYMLGAYASQSLGYALHPASDRNVSTIFSNGTIQIFAHAGDELVREFVLRRVTTRVAAYKNGQPAGSSHP